MEGEKNESRTLELMLEHDDVPRLESGTQCFDDIIESDAIPSDGSNDGSEYNIIAFKGEDNEI